MRFGLLATKLKYLSEPLFVRRIARRAKGHQLRKIAVDFLGGRLVVVRQLDAQRLAFARTGRQEPEQPTPRILQNGSLQSDSCMRPLLLIPL